MLLLRKVSSTLTKPNESLDDPNPVLSRSDDHDFDACEHFERVSDSSSSDGEEEEEEEEGSEQSRDY